MAHPTLVDRDRFALVVIDVQEKLAAAMGDRDRVVENTAKLARTAALVGAPILVTRQYPQGLGDTIPELAVVLDEVAKSGAPVTLVDKVAFCCQREPAFADALKATGRRQVVLAGMETHVCVAQTALALAGEGYAVQVPADAVCSRIEASHVATLDRLRATEVVVTTTESVMYEAVGVAGTDEFKRLLGIVKGS